MTRSLRSTHSAQSPTRDGFSLIEVLVAMWLLTVVMMGLASAATLGLSQMGKARQDLQYSADVQQITDSLVAKGWNKVADGSQTIRGRSVSWTVTNVNAKSQKLNIVVQRRGLANAATMFSDTVTLYLADVKVQ
jgi:prepilin-type N-terminal cleavage/methylation domain-containing protein